MNINIPGFAVPLFTGLMLLEYAIAKEESCLVLSGKKKSLYTGLQGR
jgi:hypothetical protein